MQSDSLVRSLIEQVEGSHLTLVRFAGRIKAHEWDWAPDVGIPSAREVVAHVVREELRIAAKLGGGQPDHAPSGAGLGTPSAAAAGLRTLRESTHDALRRALPAVDDEAARRLVHSAVALAQLDAHALGGLGVLQRLIDPTRTAVSPR
jgi:hypothetical protein